MNKDRITELESAIAFQDKTIAELSNVILGQQKELDLLKVQVKDLQRRMLKAENDEPSDEFSIDQDKPPHY